MSMWSKSLKIDLKKIWKHPLYWLLVCVFIWMFTSQVLPEIRRYGKEGNENTFYRIKKFPEREQLEREEIALKATLERGSVLYNRYLMFFYFGEKSIALPETVKTKISRLLEQIEDGRISLQKYENQIDEIKQALQPKKRFLIDYEYAGGLSAYYTTQSYEAFIEESTQIVEKVRFSYFVGGYFADIMGISVGLYPIFFVGFVQPVADKDRRYYLGALGISLLVVLLVLGGVAGKVGYEVAQMHQWSYQIQDMILPFLLLIMPTLVYGLIVNFFIVGIIRNTFAAIAIQFFHMYLTHSMEQINFYNYVIRWNNDLYPDYIVDFTAQIPEILLNRVIFLMVSIFLIWIMKRWKKI